MISLIICSSFKDISKILKTNIELTSGCNYELIVIDNSTNKYSIFSAYNEGIRRAKGDILCFMHEDILYRTVDWGKKIEDHFSDSTIGLLGFAGSHFLPSVPSYWFNSPFISEHNLTNDNGKIIECTKTEFFSSKTVVDAVACDGFCFFIRKDLFSSVKFDEDYYPGFHFYDMDICMQVLNSGSRVCLCSDVLIEHEWSENPQKKGMELFEKNQQLFFDKWKSHFPITRGIDHIPPYVIDRVNRLFITAEEAKRVRKSKAYRLGKFILSPFKYLFAIK